MSDYRQLAPGPSPTSEPEREPSPDQESYRESYQEEPEREGEPEPEAEADSKQPSSKWKKRVSTACLACKKSKRKCSGIPPCDNCRAFNRVCIFDESLDQRRRVAAKRTADELIYHRDLLNDLFKLVREADQPSSLRLLEVIRDKTTGTGSGSAGAGTLRGFIDDTLAGLSISPSATASTTSSSSSSSGGSAGEADRGKRKETVAKLQNMKNLINIEGTNPSYRKKVMDIHYLCDEAPLKVPATPWTTLTNDDDLVSHLVALYLAWDYPVHGFLDPETLIKCMNLRERGKGDLCTEFLVNCLLAVACRKYYSEFSEAYVVPGDIASKGADFLLEAEKLRPSQRASLATVQGTLLLYERYSMAGDDDMGYRMLHSAIRMGESLGLVGNMTGILSPEYQYQQHVSGDHHPTHHLDQVDFDSVTRKTAWGLFHVDTMVHTGFLRPTLITQVNVPRPDRNTSTEKSLWTPYPTHRGARPGFQSQYFDESCNLDEIAREISRLFEESPFSTRQGQEKQGRQMQRKQELYEKLRRWHGRLPDIFDPGRRPPPHIILLRMRYHTLIINLFSCTSTPSSSTSTNENNNDDDTDTDMPQTPESQPPSPPPQQPPESTTTTTINIPATTQSSARSISALSRLHRREYGLSRCHQFGMYSINLALYSLLDSADFDVLDPDFLSLASSFSVMASRSTLGRNLFHIFRQSVRGKAQGGRIRESARVSDELKGLFDERDKEGRYDEYAAGLVKLEEDERYHGLGLGRAEGGMQEYSGLGMFEMLDRYESLSLGKDEVVPAREEVGGRR